MYLFTKKNVSLSFTCKEMKIDLGCFFIFTVKVLVYLLGVYISSPLPHGLHSILKGMKKSRASCSKHC